jgi:hypothetical protein
LAGSATKSSASPTCSPRPASQSTSCPTHSTGSSTHSIRSQTRVPGCATQTTGSARESSGSPTESSGSASVAFGRAKVSFGCDRVLSASSSPDITACRTRLRTASVLSRWSVISRGPTSISKKPSKVMNASLTDTFCHPGIHHFSPFFRYVSRQDQLIALRTIPLHIR